MEWWSSSKWVLLLKAAQSTLLVPWYSGRPLLRAVWAAYLDSKLLVLLIPNLQPMICPSHFLFLFFHWAEVTVYIMVALGKYGGVCVCVSAHMHSCVCAFTPLVVLRCFNKINLMNKSKHPVNDCRLWQLEHCPELLSERKMPETFRQSPQGSSGIQLKKPGCRHRNIVTLWEMWRLLDESLRYP